MRFVSATIDSGLLGEVRGPKYQTPLRYSQGYRSLRCVHTLKHSEAAVVPVLGTLHDELALPLPRVVLAPLHMPSPVETINE